jgi:hypothetical protein
MTRSDIRETFAAASPVFLTGRTDEATADDATIPTATDATAETEQSPPIIPQLRFSSNDTK